MRNILIVALLICLSCPASDIDKAEKMVRDAETMESAKKTLKRLARNRDELTAMRAIVAWGEARRAEDFKQIRRLLKKHAQSSKENLNYPRVEGFAEYARIVAHAEKPALALQILKRAKEDAKAPLTLIVLDEALADCLVMVKEAKKAKEHYLAALALGKKHFARSKVSNDSKELTPAKPGNEHWLRIRKRIERKLKAAERLIRIEQYGVDYVLFEDARTAHLEGNFKLALKIYSLIIKTPELSGGVYAEASMFYRCLCAKKAADTIKQLQAFIKEKPNGLWRGEAHYEIARQTLLSTWDAKKAQPLYQIAIDWCRRNRTHSTAIAKYAVPEKSREVSRPPASQSTMDGFGAIHKEVIQAGKLLNRLTAKWYLNELEKQSRYGLLFTHFAQDQWDVMDVLRPVLDLDPNLKLSHRSSRPSTYMRYERCIRFRKILNEAYQFRGVNREMKTRVSYIAFIYLQREFALSESMLRSLLVEAERKKSAVPLILYNLALVVEKNLPPKATWEQARARYRERDRLFKRILAEHPNSALVGDVHHCLGNALARHKGRVDERLKHYRLAIEKLPPERAKETHLTLISVLIQAGRKMEAAKAEGELIAIDPSYKRRVAEEKADLDYMQKRLRELDKELRRKEELKRREEQKKEK